MANSCFTTYKITGSENAVETLYKNIVAFNEHYLPLCKLATSFGINYKELNIGVRGNIINHSKDEDNVITIEVESAWTGCHELFFEINKKLEMELSISYREEESGCEVFYIHDEGDFFPERFVVDCCGDEWEEEGYEYFNTIEEVIDSWCKSMNYDRGDKSIEEMKDIIYDYEYEDENSYFNIYEFELE
jgi:hypothetical protein